MVRANQKNAPKDAKKLKEAEAELGDKVCC